LDGAAGADGAAGGNSDAVRDVVGDTAACSLAAPEMRAAVERNRRLMTMRDDLPLPDLDTARLPLPYLPMRRALAGRGIILGPSLWALTGGSPPAPSAPEVEVEQRPLVWRKPTARTRREPSPDQLAMF
jgi:DNA polymerase-1